MRHRLKFAAVFLACAALAPAVATAQEPVRNLRDLVGARASSGESQMNSRGYEFVRADKAGDSAYTFWREPRSGRCVTVRTTNGEYASIVYSPDSDCGGGQASQAPAAAPDTEDNFETVCGVVVGGKEHAYRCHLRNERCAGGNCTVVTMPDNEYTIAWHKNDEIEVTFSGMKAMRSKSSFSDGRTKFDFEGKTYFVYRSLDRAKRELSKLH